LYYDLSFENRKLAELPYSLAMACGGNMPILNGLGILGTLGSTASTDAAKRAALAQSKSEFTTTVIKFPFESNGDWTYSQVDSTGVKLALLGKGVVK
jgi:hypothetical protein